MIAPVNMLIVYYITYTRIDIPLRIIRSELASGAWCPKPQIHANSYEFLQLMTGNFDTTTSVIRHLDPPVVASRIRIVPYSKQTRTICFRAELHGCIHRGITET
uniref:F5/8 type C domain-containing protein n=1 Tax=Heterorhabditis bacteriophora TaxID=37862 RepID=A0A1I7X480_HETBA